MRTSDFRRIAREGLKGQWFMAIIATFIASFLGGTIATTSSSGAAGASSSASTSGGTSAMLAGGLSDIDPAIIIGTVTTILGFALIIGIVMLCVGACIRLGYALFLGQVVRQEKGSLDLLFSQFKRFKTAVCTDFLRGLYTILWSLLFVIPGVIKSYSYAMTPYILADHPEMTATEAITASRQMMDGHKWQLFCLYCSFIGWALLAILSCGLGFLWLNPYIEVSVAAFYHSLAGKQRPVLDA